MSNKYSIYLYKQNCLKSGDVCYDKQEVEDHNSGAGSDIFLYATGTIDDIVQIAKDDIKRKSRRSGGSENVFDTRCGYKVLEELGIEL
tara:strand:+ start:741 stop:1004 length:264 start_codon:yes stop_codon:yes gene_type:complete